MIRVAASIMALFAVAPALADEPDRLTEATLARVRPGPRLYIYAEPRVERGRAYVVAGDPLVVTGHKGIFASVEFVNASGRGRSGYVLAARLQALPTRDLPLASWVGSWKQVEATITIAKSKMPGHLLASGGATWGMSDPERVKSGAIHDGSFDALFAPRDGQAAFGQGDEYEAGGTRFRSLGGQMLKVFPYTNTDKRCEVRLRILGPYLLVDDNGLCGGLNVNFDGTFRRSATR